MLVVCVSFTKFVISHSKYIYLLLYIYLINIYFYISLQKFFWKRFPQFVDALGPTNPGSAPDGYSIGDHDGYLGSPVGTCPVSGAI